MLGTLLGPRHKICQESRQSPQCDFWQIQSKEMDDDHLFDVWVVVQVEERSKDSRVIVLADLNTTWNTTSIWTQPGTQTRTQPRTQPRTQCQLEHNLEHKLQLFCYRIWTLTVTWTQPLNFWIRIIKSNECYLLFLMLKEEGDDWTASESDEIYV